MPMMTVMTVMTMMMVMVMAMMIMIDCDVCGVVYKEKVFDWPKNVLPLQTSSAVTSYTVCTAVLAIDTGGRFFVSLFFFLIDKKIPEKCPLHGDNNINNTRKVAEISLGHEAFPSTRASACLPSSSSLV